MQQMSASIAEVSRHTQSAAEAARSAAQTAHEETHRQADAWLHALHRHRRQRHIHGRRAVGEDSHRISQIVTVIDEIARKTNLSALNPAIEAARAGERAAVCRRRRRTAASLITALASGEISAMIQGIQNRTRSAIAAWPRATSPSSRVSSPPNRQARPSTRIIGMAERVDRTIAQIAIAASQQAAAANQSISALDAIHTLSHENLTDMATTTTGIPTSAPRPTPRRGETASSSISLFPRCRGKTCLSRSANAFTPHGGLNPIAASSTLMQRRAEPE